MGFDTIGLHANGLMIGGQSLLLPSQSGVGKPEIGVCLGEGRLQADSLAIRFHSPRVVSQSDVGVAQIIVRLRQVRLLFEHLVKGRNGLGKPPLLEGAKALHETDLHHLLSPASPGYSGFSSPCCAPQISLPCTFNLPAVEGLEGDRGRALRTALNPSLR